MRRFVALEYVDDDDGHVVASTRIVGLCDESVGGLLRIGGAEQRGRDLGVGDLVDQSVAAQQEAVAADERKGPPVDLDVGIDAERPRDDVAPRVGARLVLGDVAGGDEFLHVAVIDGDPSEPVVAQQVGARVADVGEHQRLGGVYGDDDRFGRRVVLVDVGLSATGERVGDDRDRGDRRAHATLGRVGDRRPEDVAVGGGDRVDHVGGRREIVFGQAGGDPLDGEFAGDLAGLVAAHAVGDDEDAVAGEDVVLVVRTELSGVGGGAPTELSHRRPPTGCPRCARALRRGRCASSLGLDDGGADLDAVARMNEFRSGQLVAVVEGAVGRPEVFDHRLTLVVVEAHVQLGNVGVVDDRDRAVRVATECDLALERDREPLSLLGFEDDEPGGAASLDLRGASLLLRFLGAERRRAGRRGRPDHLLLLVDLWTDGAPLGRSNLAPDRPQDAREEQVQQSEEDELEDVEDLVGHPVRRPRSARAWNRS